MTESSERPILIGYLPPLGGLPKTAANYGFHRTLINIGDIAYTYAGTLLTAGRNFETWNFSMPVEEVNERYSRVVFFIPCRIAPPPHDADGYPYERITRFVEGLRIPFCSLTESIQSNDFEYRVDLHRLLSPTVIRYLHVLADRSPILGTRGHYSAEVLDALGIRNAIPLGCPSLYLNGPSLNPALNTIAQAANLRNVATCYSNYQENRHSRIADILRLTRDNGYHYVEQSFGLAAKALYYPGKIDASDVYRARHLYRDLDVLADLFAAGRIRYFTNYILWRDFLSQMDFVFGARMHGLTPAVQAGVPSLFIAHDARVREMCEFFELPFLAENELPATLRIEDFQEACDYSAVCASYPNRYSRFLEALRTAGIEPNVTDSGEIRDFWEPTPGPAVVAEETVPPGPEQAKWLRKICRLAATIPDRHFETMQDIGRIAQDWYIATRHH